MYKISISVQFWEKGPDLSRWVMRDRVTHIVMPLNTAHLTLSTLHYKLYISHYTLESTNPTPYTTHYTLQALHLTLHTAHYIMQTSHCTLHALHCTLYVSHFIQLTTHCTVRYKLYTSLYKFHTKHYARTQHSILHMTICSRETAPLLKLDEGSLVQENLLWNVANSK